MLGIYDRLMRTARWLAKAVAPRDTFNPGGKTSRFLLGQRRAREAVKEGMKDIDRSRPTVWIHAASLGEFGIARPIISHLRMTTDCNIVVTFFSPTGYEALSRNGAETIDRVFYLPLDTSDNASAFLDAVNPACAVFMVSEFWHNYLHQLRERKIPALLVSAIIRDDGPFFNPVYGKLYRESLGTFSRVYTLDERSVENINRLGLTTGLVNGDPLFDNVSLVASTPWSDPVVERFKGRERLFLAGSIHRDEDLEMITELANRHPETRFIIVPHEITDETLQALEQRLNGGSKRRSACDDSTDFSTTQCLLIDSVGSLAYLYRYATWAYVGGGFTRLLHSVIEPTVYGIPVAFGPNIRRKVTPREMMRLGIGQMVEDVDDLDLWFKGLKSNENRLHYVAKRAARYVVQNTGATPRVVEEIVRLLQSPAVEGAYATDNQEIESHATDKHESDK